MRRDERTLSRAQRRLRAPAFPVTHDDYFRVARWWYLESLRGYLSSERSVAYAANMLERARALYAGAA